MITRNMLSSEKLCYLWFFLYIESNNIVIRLDETLKWTICITAPSCNYEISKVSSVILIGV
jgi:hypothetical protein